MALSDAIWASGATTTGTTWANLANAYGPNNGTTATWTNNTRRAVGTITFTFPSLTTDIPADATINSVTADVFNYTSNPTSRFTSVVGAFMSGSTVLHSQTYVLSDVNVEEVHTWTGITRAQLSGLTYRVTATRANVTQSTTFYLDAAAVKVDYTEAYVPPLELNPSDSAVVSVDESSGLSVFNFISPNQSVAIALTETSSLYKTISAINSVVPSIDGTAFVFEPIYSAGKSESTYSAEGSDPIGFQPAYPGFFPGRTWPSYVPYVDANNYITTVEDVTVAVTDSSSIASTLGRVQTVTPSLTESSQILKSIAVANTAVVSVSNASSNYKSSTVSNGVTPSVNGTATLFVEKSISDNASISLTEVQNTGGIAYQTASNNVNVALTESAAVAKLNSTGPSNSITVSVGESVQIDSMLGRTDSATPTINGASQNDLSSDTTDSVIPSVNGTASVTSVRYIEVSDSATPSVGGTVQVASLTKSVVQNVTVSLIETASIVKSIALSNGVTPSINGTAQVEKSYAVSTNVLPSVAGIAAVSKFDKPKTRAKWRINGIWTEVETKVYVNGAWRSAPQKMYYNGAWRN